MIPGGSPARKPPSHRTTRKPGLAPAVPTPPSGSIAPLSEETLKNVLSYLSESDEALSNPCKMDMDEAGEVDAVEEARVEAATELLKVLSSQGMDTAMALYAAGVFKGVLSVLSIPHGRTLTMLTLELALKLLSVPGVAASVSDSDLTAALSGMEALLLLDPAMPEVPCAVLNLIQFMLSTPSGPKWAGKVTDSRGTLGRVINGVMGSSDDGAEITAAAHVLSAAAAHLGEEEARWIAETWIGSWFGLGVVSEGLALTIGSARDPGDAEAAVALMKLADGFAWRGGGGLTGSGPHHEAAIAFLVAVWEGLVAGMAPKSLPGGRGWNPDNDDLLVALAASVTRALVIVPWSGTPGPSTPPPPSGSSVEKASAQADARAGLVSKLIVLGEDSSPAPTAVLALVLKSWVERPTPWGPPPGDKPRRPSVKDAADVGTTDEDSDWLSLALVAHWIWLEGKASKTDLAPALEPVRARLESLKKIVGDLDAGARVGAGAAAEVILASILAG